MDLSEIFRHLVPAMELAVLGFGTYAVLIGLAGLRHRPAPSYSPPQRRFAVVVPAHNEAGVIDPLLSNLAELDYPQTLYDVFVVADNCTDRTAAVANRPGVEVIVREDARRVGKGYVLEDAIRWLELDAPDTAYDAMVVIDADNLVDPGLLQAMNNRLARGENLIQSNVDAKNAADSWVAATFSMTFWVNNRFNQAARYNIGLTAALMGTGMCISTEVLQKIGWNTRSLTEDLEYSSRALLQGIKTTFAVETRIYDERVRSFRQSVRQRLRWVRGQLQVAFAYVPRLFAKGITGDVVCLDSGLRLCQHFVTAFSTLFVILRFAVPWIGDHSVFLGQLALWVQPLGAAVGLIPYALPLAVLLLDRLPVRPYRYVLLFPLFTLSWPGIIIWGVLTCRRMEWFHTEHSRAVTYNELKTVNT